MVYYTVKRNRNTVLYIFLLIILTCFATAGCSNEKSYETGQGKVTVKEDGKKFEVKNEDEGVTVEGDETQGQVKIKTKDGESIISYNKNKLPDNFPKEIPVYSPASVQMTQNMENGKNVMASLTTDDDPGKVMQFYKKAFNQAGWEVKGEMNMGNTSLLQGEKGGKELNVTVNRDQEKTVIALVLSDKQP
jgi:hypothetical protein